MISNGSGRAASLARRQALAQGKTALPAATERVRTGFREARVPAPGTPAVSTAPTSSATAIGVPVAAVPPFAGGGGRFLAMLRRQQLAQGKRALLAAAPAGRIGETPSLDLPASPAAPASLQAAETAASAPAGMAGPSGSCREQARARRAQLALHGRGQAPAAAPGLGPRRPPRKGSLQYAPKVAESTTQGAQRVTGVRIGRGPQVTGDEAGAALPVTGTQYVVAAAAAAARGAPVKVGLARTAGGLIVSGTQLRSRIRITGDEAGERLAVTGEADPKLADDLTPGRDDNRYRSAQFPRRADPHGASVFGMSLGGALRAPAARGERRALEVTAGGQPVTGTAVGRSARVTGDEDGACRTISGDQYLSPAAASSACGGTGGGTAPAEHLRSPRRDPVTGAKVTEALTWGGQRVTGPDLEHRPAVTGDEPGSCATITGTPYQGPSTAFGWCDPAQAEAAAQRQGRGDAHLPVTGDVPKPAAAVTGTERGAGRGITGTPYFAADPQAAQTVDPLADIDRRFSVKSPQRQAQLRADRHAAAAPSAAARITGAFAVGAGKITGNVEFLFRPRQAAEADPRIKSGGPRITGEGRTQGPAITGDAWADDPRVTGTEGYIAAERNPSERAGKPHAFAGAGLFKGKGRHDEPRQIVTGMVGWTAKSAAKVTLSGGAQG
jgi:hypothetical protein